MIKRVYLLSNACSFIQAELEAWPDVETGGALFGYLSMESAVVSHATDPGPRGLREATGVLIDGVYVTKLEKTLHNRSQGRLHYLGDWHVHPRGPITPSNLDVQAAHALLKAEVCIGGFTLALIVSRKGKIGAFAVWPLSVNPTPIPLINCPDPPWISSLLESQAAP